ncbi:chymotrypsin-like elastase family member 2A isoform X2 [Maniola jurtina]|uniref:chymotrypsin-like elastase family member 2A isoform X2 n=1 Tax=Maniola jurtina TaxID=191418 RepID=UPI001E688C0F|nr:chymotrypsin-like elastase family member 2A isoform X2 [Maniola jurtina]
MICMYKKMKRILLIFTSIWKIIDANSIPNGMPYGNPIVAVYPCNDSRDIVVWYDTTLPPKERNQYYLYVNKALPLHASIEVKFNADVNIIMQIRTANNTFTTLSMRNGTNVSQQYRTTDPYHIFYGYKVKGTAPGRIPYVTSVKINNVEYCNQPNLHFLDAYAADTVDDKTPQNCGRRKIGHVELIVNGAQTKPGDWPWHTAVYKFDYPSIKYICGGTLLSKHFVLTAAHCASVRGVSLSADILSVVLGKYNLFGGDVGSQEREIHRIIIHEEFQYRYLHNDIALLKMKTEVVFTDYIQPACLWYDKASEKLLTDEILGTVVGWGFDSSDTLSRTIRQAQMPIVADSVCMTSNPNFYTSILTDKKFCAGYRNQTSACNGDSGSAFQVFIPDMVQRNVDTRNPGTWLVRGIVSLTVSREYAAICDPDQYVVFTDVAKYISWIQNYILD